MLALLGLPAWAEPGEAYVELPSPTLEEMREFHRQLGLDPATVPPEDQVANSVRACFYRPEVAPLMIRMEWATRRSLTPRLYWMLAVAVSGRNRCGYCLSAFRRGLVRETGDEELDRLLAESPAAADLPLAEAAAVEYALELTTSPAAMASSKVQRLRDAGWSDREIYEIALITSWCNFMNRMALGLGYGPDHSHPFEE